MQSSVRVRVAASARSAAAAGHAFAAASAAHGRQARPATSAPHASPFAAEQHFAPVQQVEHAELRWLPCLVAFNPASLPGRTLTRRRACPRCGWRSSMAWRWPLGRTCWGTCTARSCGSLSCAAGCCRPRQGRGVGVGCGGEGGWMQRLAGGVPLPGETDLGLQLSAGLQQACSCQQQAPRRGLAPRSCCQT